MTELRSVELIFLLLLLFIIWFGQIARKIGTPYPIVMIIGGLLLGFVPWIPKITFDPDLIFLVVLPPLIYSSAWTTSWRDFRFNIVSILFLAFGLVGFTVVGVALLTPRLLSGFDWRLGLVLGAIVAPTDAIAATSIARKVGLPSRIVDVLEGESLINDATGLLALQFAVAMVVSREIPTVSEGVLTLLWLVIGGVAVGLAIGWIVCYAERRIDDGPIEIALSLLVPYGAYFAADAIHASGVLAVVASGLFLTRRSATMFSPPVRIQIWSFWQSFTFILNGLVFVLIGLQLRTILSMIRDHGMLDLIRDGALFSITLIVLRLLWVFPGAHISHFIRRKFDHQLEPIPPTRQIFVVGWTGMRGGVSLAAALAVPAVLDNGNPFPQREFIVFLTFCVILVTLVLQGLTLPALIRALKLQGSGGPDCEEREARRLVLEAAVAHLEQSQADSGEDVDEAYEDVVGHYRSRLAGLSSSEDEEVSLNHRRFVDLSKEAAKIERETAIRLRNEGRINDQVLRRLERELDLTESKYAKALED
ncbi:Na+/H+ antiporter [Acidicapsa dinghuensis]|uniref:Na+/H+ antiporter n=1 Tax=Acidicapsa dinghuensis TaxID=2218256 RepID=A0ABW1E9E9_9BACT|nr:Na+/H+ antiporter [Acidicapsa dinghuensis]